MKSNRPGIPPNRRPGKENTHLGNTPIAARSKYQRLLFDADRFFKEKDYPTAFKIYQQALPEAPTGDTRALAQLCRCYRKKALKALKRANHQAVFDLLQEMMHLEHVQPHIKARDYLVFAEVCLELSHLDSAQKSLLRATDLDPHMDEIRPLQKRLKTELLHREMNGLH